MMNDSRLSFTKIYLRRYIIMYEYEGSLMDRVNQLETENTSLRKELGEFSFFGPAYSTPWQNTLRNDLKKKLTVDEWELISKMNIGYHTDDMKRCVSILTKLINQGVFNANVHSNPWGYYGPNNRNTYPTYQTPFTYGNPYVVNPSVPENTVAEDNNGKKYTGKTISIDIPSDMAAVAHETFKGSEDYINNNVVITNGLHDENTTTITICIEDVMYPWVVETCIDRIITKVMATEPKFVNPFYIAPVDLSTYADKPTAADYFDYAGKIHNANEPTEPVEDIDEDEKDTDEDTESV